VQRDVRMLVRNDAGEEPDHQSVSQRTERTIVRTVWVVLFMLSAVYARQFRSEYTDFGNCKWASEGGEGEDGTNECEGMDDYHVFAYYSGNATIRKILLRDNPGSEILLLPETEHEDVYRIAGFGAKIEWRLYGSEPIAIIYRVTIHNGSESATNKQELLLVRGLYRYSEIEADVDAKNT
jgi:hypothetical protein